MATIGPQSLQHASYPIECVEQSMRDEKVRERPSVQVHDDRESSADKDAGDVYESWMKLRQQTPEHSLPDNARNRGNGLRGLSQNGACLGYILVSQRLAFASEYLLGLFGHEHAGTVTEPSTSLLW